MGHMQRVMRHVSYAMCHVSCVMCHVSCVLRHVSCVLCQMSLRPTAPATDPPHAKSPTMHFRLILKDQTNKSFVFPEAILALSQQKIDNSNNTLLSLCFSKKS